MKPRIYLHVGMGKTGTSAIQSALAIYASDMAEQGILYPEHDSLSHAATGGITSGNLTLFLTGNDSWFTEQITKRVLSEPEYSSFVFSNELMLDRVDDLLEGIGQNHKDFDFVVIVGVRDPIGQNVSLYHQYVKRSGLSTDINSWLSESKPRGFAIVAQILEASKAGHFDCVLLNYSYFGRQIVAEFLNTVGYSEPHPPLTQSERTVNRSLTKVELDLILELNSLFPPIIGDVVSTALIEKIPDLPPFVPKVRAEVWSAYLEQRALNLQVINDSLTAHKLNLSQGDTQKSVGSTTQGALTERQQQIARDAIANHFATQQEYLSYVAFERDEAVSARAEMAKESDHAASERDKLVVERDDAIAESERYKSHLTGILNSRSWRWTSFLRR